MAPRKKTFQNKFVERSIAHFDARCYDFKVFYCPLALLEGERNGKYEHFMIYDDALENPEAYYYNIPPVTVEMIEQGKYVFHDGFHRVNFCKKFTLPVPAILLTPKPGTHIHIYIGGNSCHERRIFDTECAQDFQTPVLRCLYVRCRKTGESSFKKSNRDG